MMKFYLLLLFGFSCYWGEVLLSLGLCVLGFLLLGSEGAYYSVGSFYELDSLGYSLSILSAWVIFMSFAGSVYIKNRLIMSGYFANNSVLLLVGLIFSFSVSDFLYFYVSFELCLIPVFIMVMGWGYQPERVRAGSYLFIYTLLGSLPLFFTLLFLFLSQGSSYMGSGLSGPGGELYCLFFIIAFLVKYPIYGGHLWLLKAHVEAPVAGSMILAGILLKLGGYGLIRVLGAVDLAFCSISSIVIISSLAGGALMSFLCLRYTDMKLLIASSSVVHMSVCISGSLSYSLWGIEGSIFMMVAHGLSSSGLFYLANNLYERSHSRSLYMTKGMINFLPGAALVWFLMVSSNLAAPPFFNLLSEISLFVCLLGWDFTLGLFLGLMSFFGAAYSLYLFAGGQHGVFYLGKGSFSEGVCFDYLVGFMHLFPLVPLVVFNLA